MKYFKNIYQIAAVAMIITTFSACNKLIDVKMPVGSSDTKAIYATEAGAESAVRGMYAYLTGKSMIPHGVMVSELGLYSDELELAAYNSIQQLYYENAIHGDLDLSGFWDFPYSVIYQANNIIDNLDAATQIPVEKKFSFIAEAKFLRALMYFNLVNLYGEVPLVTTADYTKNVNLPRTAIDLVYNQVIEDLQYAKKYLLNNHNEIGNRLRASSYAASSLLARVYLFQKRYADAEAEATYVIDAKEFELDNLGVVFQKESKETILALSNWLNLNMTNANIAGSNFANTNMRLSNHIVKLFEPNDLRLINWGRTGTGIGTGTVAPFKYKFILPLDANGKTEYKQVIRYADVLLIRAEASNELNNKSEALADLDQIRLRAGLMSLAISEPHITKDELRERIFKERATEFFAEGGNRWLDIKRRGEDFAIDYMSTIKPGFTKSDLLFPIPNVEIRKNPKLIQNDDY